VQAAIKHHKLAGPNTHVMILPTDVHAVTDLFSGSLAAVMQLKWLAARYGCRHYIGLSINPR
jgi:hypothetical protein